MSFEKLVRYEHDGRVHYGDLLETLDEGYRVVRLGGNLREGFTKIEAEPDIVKKLLCPIEQTPIIHCIGVNYHQHAKEANITVPEYPVLFTKPPDTLAGPHDSIPIPTSAQPKLDFEGELTIVISRDATDVSASDASSYILGYTAGNDISARNFQLRNASGGQFGYSKSFDFFAPIGPAIWSASAVGDPAKLKLTTRVNGEVRQETSVGDMIWGPGEVVSHLSRGRTLRRGTVIMMGTPAGVGFFEGRFLGDGDVVEVEIEGLGKIQNTMVFQ